MSTTAHFDELVQNEADLLDFEIQVARLADRLSRSLSSSNPAHDRCTWMRAEQETCNQLAVNLAVASAWND